jgi:transcriptional antiterminator RfaH
MPLNWYAINSHPNKEEILWRHLLSQGIEVFYPRLRVTPVNPRSRKIRPYFPGYMFVRSDLETTGRSIFQWMPYTKGLVSAGGEPVSVPDELISAIRARVEHVDAIGAKKLDGLTTGDAVVIENGPFEGYEAIFDLRISGSERVRVLLKMLNARQVPLELRAGSIRKKST